MALEYVEMADPIFDKIYSKVERVYKNACILWIQKIHNSELERRFEEEKARMTARLGDDVVFEKFMFHGTIEENMRSICQEGFLVEKNKASAYGVGTYFATRADMSKFYAQPSRDGVSFMLYCKVLIGNVVTGGGRKGEVIDNYVDSYRKPSIIVCTRDDMCIPVYAIAFRR